jgi:quercetin dioxygenase-like cupin family protein
MKTPSALLALPLLAGLWSSPAPAADPATSSPLPLHFEDVVRQNPIDPARGSVVTEVLRGDRASVNVWQMSSGMPAHYHRHHEEVIIVKSGAAAVRIGDRTITMRAGDIVLVPRGAVHAAKAIAGEGEPFRGISVFAPAFDGKDRIFVDAGSSMPAGASSRSAARDASGQEPASPAR